MDYYPPPTVKRFLMSGAFGRWIVGPVGSGKTTGCIMDLMLTAAAQKPAPDGLRYSRMALIRNTLQQLKTTVLPDVEQFLGPAATFHTTTNTIRIRTSDLHSDWILTPLDKEEDQQRLLSLQLTAAWIEEFREVPQALVAPLSGRCGRYPGKAVVAEGAQRYGIIGSTNPFADASEWDKFLCLEPSPDHVLFRQPSARKPEAENLENLKPGYYERLVKNSSAEWVKVHIDAENGEDLAGTAVFKTSFLHSFHVSASQLLVNRMRPIVVGLDFGRTPTALICQEDAMGCMLVLEEVLSEDMGLRQFIQQKLRPALGRDVYTGLRVVIVADPAGRQKSQVNEESPFDVLRDEGMMAIPAPSNDIEVRLRAVEKRLLERRGPGAAMLIDQNTCPKLVKAMRTEYRYQRAKTGNVADLPAKTHPWSDLADALQYASMGFSMDAPGLATRIMARRNPLPQPQVPAAAWT